MSNAREPVGAIAPISISPSTIDVPDSSNPEPAPTVALRLVELPEPAEQGEGGEGGDPASPAPSLPPSAPPVSPAAKNGASPVFFDDVYKPAPKSNPVLGMLKSKGLLGSPAGDGQHEVTCPWSEEHSTDGEGKATYLSPTTDLPLGGFHCSHRHENPKHIRSLLDHLDIDPSDARCKPRIRTKRGELHRIVSAAERVLADNADYYNSGGAIVSIRVDPQSGEIRTEPVTEAGLSLDLSRLADWEACEGKGQEWKRCDVPQKVVSTLLRQPDYPQLRRLTGLARQPYFRPDRSFVMQPGYDAETGILASFNPAEFALPEPTEANARAAHSELQALIGEFHFSNDADRAAALCAILTSTIRGSLPLAPAFSISASSSGSGKSYLASVVCPFAGPGEPLNVSYPTTNEEATKLCLSMGFTQPATVLFDDMPTDWLPLGAMNKLLTSATISERVLGTNKMATVLSNAMVIGTGNNIRPIRDMARRVVSVYLLPKKSITELRYTTRPAEMVRANRSHYVGLGLTIIRAWIAAGSPRCDVPDIASFGTWSDLCRQPLMWLGEPDPASSLIHQINHDPDLEALGALLEIWYAQFGNAPTFLRKILKLAEKNAAVKEVLEEMPFTDRGYVNPSKFGWYLSKNANRIVNGLQLTRAPSNERNAWMVEAVDAAAVETRRAERDRMNAENAATWVDGKSVRNNSPIDPDEIF